MDLSTTEFFGLTAVPIVYYLIQHSRRNDYLKGGRAFLAVGVVWALLVGLHAFAPTVARYVLMALGGWAATLLFKAGAKDNERP